MKKNKTINNLWYTKLALRLGLIIVLAYAGINSLLQPIDWVGYLPSILTHYIAADTLIKLLSIYELILVAWLIIGRFIKYCGLVCALTFVFIVIFNFSQLLITFRDIGLIFMGLALYFISKDEAV
jgi:uncharacterized membrane protein YphA (DoxX/SURF4 family)